MRLITLNHVIFVLFEARRNDAMQKTFVST